jgi:hypothetical protein
VPLERRHRRLEEDEHLGGGIERELLGARGKCARRRVTVAVRPVATGAGTALDGAHAGP